MITLLAVSASLAASVVSASAESCFLVQQLADPHARAQYEQKIAEAKEAESSVYGSRRNYSADFLFATGESQTVDSFSFDCMSCHDGMNAKYHDVRIRNGEREGSMSLQTVLASHPIGMHYGSAAYENRSLRDQRLLNSSMTMVDGRVGCLSCHNLLNPEKNHLAVDNSSSGLCLECHAK